MITSLQRAEQAPNKRWPGAGRLGRLRRPVVAARTLAVLAGVGTALALAAGPAGAQTTQAPPKPGVTLGVAGEGNERLDMFYTGTDRQVWMVHMSPMGQNIPESLGGHLTGGPAAVYLLPGGQIPSGFMVFGRGTDNRLWWRHQTSSGWSSWTSLGGNLTSKPTATIGGAMAPGAVAVFARGADGAVWGRAVHGTPSGGLAWTPWFSLGGRLLAGTAPAAASNDSGSFLATVGTDHAVWVAEQLTGQVLSWHSIGGRTTSNPGIATPSAQAAVAFVRGTDNAGWYNEFLGQTAGVTAGWHSLHGTLTSGVTAFTQAEGSVLGPTSVFALGSDSRAWIDTGTWPSLTGWQPVRVGP